MFAAASIKFVGGDGRIGRLVAGEGLLDTEAVQRGDIAAVRCVFDRGPHIWFRSNPQFGSGAGKQAPPERSQAAQSLDECRVVIRRTIEAARVAAFMNDTQPRGQTARS